MNRLTFTALLVCSASLAACGGSSTPESAATNDEATTLAASHVVPSASPSSQAADTGAQETRGFPADHAGYKVAE
ncbi:MAG TPA: hypothetical protein VJ652_10215 [Noviherbaspirillum sp.]|nr:hypothetical protein [Noviherbaspirillum sp.]